MVAATNENTMFQERPFCCLVERFYWVSKVSPKIKINSYEIISKKKYFSKQHRFILYPYPSSFIYYNTGTTNTQLAENAGSAVTYIPTASISTWFPAFLLHLDACFSELKPYMHVQYWALRIKKNENTGRQKCFYICIWPLISNNCQNSWKAQKIRYIVNSFYSRYTSIFSYYLWKLKEIGHGNFIQIVS